MVSGGTLQTFPTRKPRWRFVADVAISFHRSVTRQSLLLRGRVVTASSSLTLGTGRGEVEGLPIAWEWWFEGVSELKRE